MQHQTHGLLHERYLVASFDPVYHVNVKASHGYNLLYGCRMKDLQCYQNDESSQIRDAQVHYRLECRTAPNFLFHKMRSLIDGIGVLES